MRRVRDGDGQGIAERRGGFREADAVLLLVDDSLVWIPIEAKHVLPLLEGAACITMHDMKTSALTIRLDPDLQRRLSRAAKRSGRTRSEVVRDALRRQLAVAQFEDLRRRIMPFAEAQGYLTDEDVFRDVS